MATSLTDGKLTVNNLTFMGLGQLTLTMGSAGYSCHLPSGGSWFYPLQDLRNSNHPVYGFGISSGGTYVCSISTSLSGAVAYAIRYS